MKLVSFVKRTALGALICAALSLPAQTISIETEHFTVDFQVGDDGRLYQHAIGAANVGEKPLRTGEAYPQAGDGYIWEPALQVVHADGNTSTTLLFQSVTQTNETTGIKLTRIQLRDPAYPFEVSLCFRAYHNEDVIEQWTEIRHHEPGPVTLERMASTSLLLAPTNVYLDAFLWRLGEGNVYPDHRTDHSGHQNSGFQTRRARGSISQSVFYSFAGWPADGKQRRVFWPVRWNGPAVFNARSMTTAENIRALCGVNPFASAYHLNPDETFTTPKMIWVWSANGLGEMSRKLHRWARDFGMRDGHKTRAVLLNNWEATGFDFDFNRIVGLFDPAKELGVELFLLDDGWFGNKYPRVNDHAGLGDWQPNRSRLPDGLAPLAAEAVKRGLRFGIWMEPEMVNPKSELFEQHPDWVIRQPKRELELQRNQLVLDLTRPEVQDLNGTPSATF